MNYTAKKLHSEILCQEIERHANSDMLENKIGAASIAVKQNGKIIFKKFYGTASPGIPVTDSTLYRLASMTKPITAALILSLTDNGLLSLEDEVERYLPEYKNLLVAHMENGIPVSMTPSHTKPTLLHLLTHTSGIGSGLAEQFYASKITADDNATLEKKVRYYGKIPLSFEPFTKEEYSGTVAFDVLARIAELVTETDYDTLVKKRICEPCGMSDTTFVPSSEQYNRLVSMHNRTNGKSIVAQMPAGCIFQNIPTTHYLGGAGLVSSLSDYQNFAEMLLNEGISNGERVLMPETARRMATPQVPAKIQPGCQRWGLGVRVITDSAYRRLPVGTFGWSGAYGTHFWVDPVNHITAVYMKNSLFDGGSGAQTAVDFEESVFTALSHND